MGTRARRAHSSRRRTRRRRRTGRAARVVRGAALLVVLAVAVVTLRIVMRDDVLAETRPEAEPPPVAEIPAAGDPTPPEPEPEQEQEQEQDSEPAPDSEPTDEERIPVPETGPGTFRVARGGGEPVGGDTVLTYRLEVEDGIEIAPDEAATEVQDILADPRGWTAEGDTGFHLVGEGPADFVVQIATPGTVDDICGQYGLDTGGEVNCSVAQTVVVNLRRWVEGSPQFPGPVEEYRALIINHEVGHYLGHGHEGCPEPGAPAPAMMQQIRGLDGCVANAWPHDENGTYLSGPSVP
ncbi:DUF3152 domain-containing protein [Streptomyces sp. 8K308]|uniref:DUF3152 domain-containing protein n=1 Tax=Streptomyces sp. 8K308 TaxID=2530388 RepID=UPI001045921E|nr:DUF3152 domain-containing protein [Streptomyces sp. 8K308]TDC27308.1 DUF3152 domain-containing protein [Streptomyces sp. 8K308]